MIYAVDFDGTLSINGNPNQRLIVFLRQRQSVGDVVILHTSRTGAALNEAVRFCFNHGLRFNSVYGGKPIADIYIDDKAMKP